MTKVKTTVDLDVIDIEHDMLLVKKRLISLRKQKKLTQAQLADELGITRSLLASWEAGTRIPDAVKLVMLSRFFNVSIGYLLGISDCKTKSFIALKD